MISFNVEWLHISYTIIYTKLYTVHSTVIVYSTAKSTQCEFLNQILLRLTKSHQISPNLTKSRQISPHYTPPYHPPPVFRINKKTRNSYSVDKATAMISEIEELRHSYRLRNHEKKQLLLVCMLPWQPVKQLHLCVYNTLLVCLKQITFRWQQIFTSMIFIFMRKEWERKNAIGKSNLLCNM